MHVYVSDTVIYTDHDDVVYIYIYMFGLAMYELHISHILFFFENLGAFCCRAKPATC